MARDPDRSGSRPVASVARALALLDELGRAPEGLGVNELARRIAVNASTASRLLATLEAGGMVERAPGGGPYRLGLGLVALADGAGWGAVFTTAALILFALGAVVSRAPMIAVESTAPPPWLPTFRAWLARPGAIGVFLFVLTYKLGDASMGPMVKPFWIDRGLSVTEIGLVSTTLGVALSILGALCGGAFTSRFGVFRGLWVLGLAQAFSNLGYAAAAATDSGRAGIYAASAVESFSGGLGTAAFLAFLMRACQKEQAATQYALLSALFNLTRTVANMASGFGAERLGYAAFFAFTFALSFPAYLLLPWVRVWSEGAGERSQSAPM